MAAGPVPRPEAAAGFDARVAGAAALVRFASLVAVMIASSAAMALDLLHELPFRSAEPGCALAAGSNPLGGFLSLELPPERFRHAYAQCLARFGSGPPRFGAFAVVGVLAVAAVLLYWALPAWKGRGGRVIPVDAAAGSLPTLLAELATRAAVAPAPRFVIDPAAATASAVVFGRPGRYTVCLDAGLVAGRDRDPDGFRAVVLHELAHIRNRDVGVTYAAVALWRVYLIALVVPYAIVSAGQLLNVPGLSNNSIWSVSDRVSSLHALTLSVFLIALVYLARADILRSREIYADLAAAAWGADHGAWDRHSTRQRSRGAVWLASFAGLWRTHPTWEQRQRSLASASLLRQVPALQMFLAGAAATIAQAELSITIASAGGASVAAQRLPALVIAALLAVVVATALWRAVAYTAPAGKSRPSGVATGLWLGAGLVAGELVVFSTGVVRFFPAQPAFLLPLTLAAVLAAWWATDYAELILQVPGSRRVRGPALAAGVIPVWLVLAAGLVWWAEGGYVYASGGVMESVRAAVNSLAMTPVSGHAGTVAMIADVVVRVGPVVYSLAPGNTIGTDSPLTLALLAMWLLPLLTCAALGRARSAQPAGAPASSRWLRPVLRGAVTGAVAGVAGEVAALMFLLSWHVPPGRDAVTYLTISLGWLVTVLAAGSGVAAVTAAALARRYAVLSGIAAAGMAVLPGLAAAFALYAGNGCVPAVAFPPRACHWDPSAGWLYARAATPFVLGPGMLAAVTLAVVTAAAIMAARRIRPAARIPAEPPTVVPAAGARALSQPRVAVLAGAVAIVFAAAAAHPFSPGTSTGPGGAGLAFSAPSSAVLRYQVQAWRRYGGVQLLSRYAGELRSFAALLNKQAVLLGPDGAKVIAAQCGSLARLSLDTRSYFPVPDPPLEAAWTGITASTAAIAKTCRSAVRTKTLPLLIATEAGASLIALGVRVETFSQTSAAFPPKARPHR